KSDLITKGTQSTSLVCNKKCDTEDINQYLAETTPEKKQDQSTIIPEDEVLSLTNSSEVEVEDKPDLITKGTQSTSLVCNKKCDTEDLNEYIAETTPEKKQDQSTIIPEDEVLSLTNRSEVEVEGGMNTYLDLKLMGDDYDLTPERDTSEKYHFLMTDASTSMVKSQVAVATNVGIDSLLLGDAYDLHEDSALQSIRDIEDSTAYLRTKIPFYEDDISASISQSCSMTESPGWISDKPGLQYPVLKKFSKAKVLVRLNTCTNTSTTSVKT
uniref:Uncharacterized protein LOC114327534 n=1 Tax=Diabrotica virgifera virgifera TaxID=50390 RepID=A0A6P7FFC3_DIAVI